MSNYGSLTISGLRQDTSTAEMTYVQISKQLTNLEKHISDLSIVVHVFCLIQMQCVVLQIVLTVKCTKSHWIPQLHYVVFS